MASVSRYCMIVSCLVLVIAIFSCGCTSSSGSTAGGSSGTGADNSGYHSTFAELAGTYVNVDNPSSSIILYPDGAAHIGTGSSGTDTSIYMESDVLYLADGTSIGAYPIQDGTLTYQGSKFRKQS
jgi:hypothetical protein